MANHWQEEEMPGQGRGSQAQSWNQGGSSGQGVSGRGSQGELIWQNRIQKQMRDAEQNEPDGALTAGYKADPREIVALLTRAQASEWSSFLQYWHHYFMASDIHSAELRDIFKEHAEDEYAHARLFGERIQQLGG